MPNDVLRSAKYTGVPHLAHVDIVVLTAAVVLAVAASLGSVFLSFITKSWLGYTFRIHPWPTSIGKEYDLSVYEINWIERFFQL